MGVMISTLQSRDFGFGFPDLTEDELDTINILRRGQHYVDREAAIAVHDQSIKKPLIKHPFIQEFKYGVAKDGYWSYEHLVCQLNDCMDVMKALYPQFYIKFNVDHSCGHDRQRLDALNVNRMNVNYGGSQPHMHSSKMTTDCIGTFDGILDEGDIQDFVWKITDAGPTNLQNDEKELLRNGDLTEFKFVNKSKSELIRTMRAKLEDLTWKGVPLIMRDRGMYADEEQLTMDQLRKICRMNDLPFRKRKKLLSLKRKLILLFPNSLRHLNQTIF